MSEITPSASDSGLYYQYREDNSVVPLDPINREPLRPGVIPESLANDPVLAEGYEFLRANATRINAQLLLTNHGDRNGLLRSGILLDEVAQDLAKHGGVLFLEGVATESRAQTQERTFNEVAGLDKDRAEEFRNLLHAHPRRESFDIEQLFQLAGSGVAVRFPDYRKDGESEPEKALNQWRNRLKEVEAAIEAAWQNELPELYDSFSKLYLGFVAYRDWFIVGKMGALLKTMDKPSRSVDMALLAGLQHPGIGEHLAGFGIQVSRQGELNSSAKFVRLIVGAVGRAALSQTDRVNLIALGLQEHRDGLLGEEGQ